MSWSLGELQALAVTAARGSAMPHGLAEDAGAAVRWLSAHRLPGPDALADYLAQCASSPPPEWRGERAENAPACPIVLGTVAADDPRRFAAGGARELGSVRQPLLLVPFLARATSGEAPIAITWPGASIRIPEGTVHGRDDAGGLIVSSAPCRLERVTDAGSPARDLATRVESAAADAMQTLERLAARTYAPATEQSRLTGAGAKDDDD